MRRRTQQGAALLEMAMTLPFALLLFLAMSDFARLFYFQGQIESAARSASAEIRRDGGFLAARDVQALRAYAESLQVSTARDADLPGVAHTLSVHYACPLADGSEAALTDLAQGCDRERIYISLGTRLPVEPALQPLAHTGFPKAASTRSFIRVQ